MTLAVPSACRYTLLLSTIPPAARASLASALGSRSNRAASSTSPPTTKMGKFMPKLEFAMAPVQRQSPRSLGFQSNASSQRFSTGSATAHTGHTAGLAISAPLFSVCCCCRSRSHWLVRGMPRTSWVVMPGPSVSFSSSVAATGSTVTSSGDSLRMPPPPTST